MRRVDIISLAIIAFLLLSPPWSLLGKANLVGQAICHQLAAHSYHPGGRQLPLCARCTGTYLGILLGFISLWATRRRASNPPPSMVLAVLVSFIALMAIDGLNSYLPLFLGLPHLYRPRNILRLITGTLSGLALSVIVHLLFNFTLWKEADPGRAIRNFRQLGFLMIPAALYIWAVHSQIAVLFYPIALLSTLGVLAMLTLLNTTILLIVTHRQRTALVWSDALWPLTNGLAASLMEIGAMALARAVLS